MRLRDVEGRTHRLGFLAYVLIVNLFVYGLIEIVVATMQSLAALYAALALSAIGTLIVVAAVIRRYHDLGHSGWWLLWLFIPLVNFGFFLYLLLWPGEPNENRFGPPPNDRDEPDSEQQQRPSEAVVQTLHETAPKHTSQRGILWPRTVASASTISVRLGRVLHWLSCGIAGITAVFAVGNYLSYGYLSDVLPALVFAAGIFIVGRGLRYVFAGE